MIARARTIVSWATTYRGRPLGWLWVLLATSCALAFVPLFDVLGYEFSLAVGVVAGFAAGHVGICVVRRARAAGSDGDVLALCGTALADSLPLLVAPLAVISMNAARVHNCDYLAGLAFYGVIPVVSVVYGACGGVLFGLATATARRGMAAWSVWVLGSVVLIVVNVVRHPPMFGYHALFGYVRGSIYDDDAHITTTLLVARLLALLTAGCFAAVAHVTHDRERQRCSWRVAIARGPAAAPRVFAVCIVLANVVGWLTLGPLGVRPDRGDVQRALGASRETAHFVIYFDPASAAARHMDIIAADHEFRYDQLRDFFGFDVDRKIGSYLYPSREKKQKLMGAKDAHMADPINREMHLNYAEFPHSSLKHEIAHVFTGEFHPLMKVSPAPGLVEGVAVAAEWDEGRLTAHQWAKAMMELDLLPDVVRLMSLRGFWGASAARAYPAAGSFVRWLRDVYGPKPLAAVYAFGRFEKHYGRSLPDLRDDWLEHLADVPLSKGDVEEARRRFERRSFFQRACAHALANIEDEAWASYYAADYAGARRGFERLAALEPGNAANRWRVLQMTMAAGEWDAVSALAEAMLRDDSIDASYRAQAEEAAADAAWRGGSVEDAAAAFAHLAMDAHVPSARRRLAVKRDALALQPKAQRLVQSYFEWQAPQLRLYRLRELTASAPDWALGHYLLGRALLNADAWQGADDSLRRAESVGLPSEEFAREARMQRGESLYMLGLWPAAEAEFALAAESTPWQGERDTALDWAERCRWAAGR